MGTKSGTLMCSIVSMACLASPSGTYLTSVWFLRVTPWASTDLLQDRQWPADLWIGDPADPDSRRLQTGCRSGGTQSFPSFSLHAFAANDLQGNPQIGSWRDADCRERRMSRRTLVQLHAGTLRIASQ